MHFDPHFILTSLPDLLHGLAVTLWLVAVSTVLGIAIALIICTGKLYAVGAFNAFCRSYVVIVRGIPEIVIMFWVYYCCPLMFDVHPSGFVCAAIAMALYSGAMFAEVFRAGILSVPPGQHQAAKALALPGFWMWCEIIAPQAVRTMIPALLGLLSLQIKISGMASAIGVGELVYTASIIGGQTFRYFELFTTIGALYFVIIFGISMAARAYEVRLRRLAK